MSSDVTYFWGIDCGSTEIKVVVMNRNRELIHFEKRRTLFPLMQHVRAALKGTRDIPAPWDETGQRRPNHRIVATGYGRSHIDFVDDKLTEIKSHWLGVETLMRDQLETGAEFTIADIGGQDSKLIMCTGDEVRHFVINRKCAAGTGAYIEELAHRLEIPLEKMSALNERADKDLTLNSYCTVFAGQEVIRVLMEGEKVENLIRSLYQSVVKRLFEMAPITTAKVYLSGGVFAHHSALRDLMAQRLAIHQRSQLVPFAQYAGAIGACEHGRRQ